MQFNAGTVSRGDYPILSKQYCSLGSTGFKRQGQLVLNSVASPVL